MAAKITVSEAQQVASLCRLSYEDFVKEFWFTVVQEPLVWNWHMSYLCEQVQKSIEAIFEDKPAIDIVCNVSPGTSKSTLFTVMSYPWAVTRMPHFKMIGISSTEPLALELSRKTRDLMKSEKYQACFPYIKLRKDLDNKHFYATEQGGWRYAAGTGGNVIGRHAHLITIDDPLDPNNIASEAELRAANQFVLEVLPQRKISKVSTATHLVMQRLSEDDPSANFSKSVKNRIVLPATSDAPIHPPHLKKFYTKDGCMDKNRLSRPVLQEIEKRVSKFTYASQYNQSPIPLSGGMFDTDKITIISSWDYLLLINNKDIPRKSVRYWDKAATDQYSKGGNQSAYTVGVRMDYFPQIKITVVSDVIRVRVNSGVRERLIVDTAKEDGIDVIVGLEQEPGSGGKQSAEMTVENLIGYIVHVDAPRGNKEIRADPYSVQVNNGSVRLLKADWNDQYLSELKYFPFSKYKDQVDASSGGLSVIVQSVTVGAIN